MSLEEERLNSLDNRLSRIEKLLNLSSTPPKPQPVEVKAQTQAQSQSQLQPQESSKARPGNWLGVIAIICFVLAAAFIVKLSIDTGWLTPARQICLTVLLGISLIVAGLALLKKDKEYVSLLPAGGIIILYLSAFAAYQVYQLIPFTMALNCFGLVTIFCIGLYRYIKHDMYAITAAIGAYAAPFLASPDTLSLAFSVYYFLFCSFAFATISVWVSSRTLTVVAAYLAILANTMLGLMHENNDQLISVVLLIQFLIFSVGTLIYTYTTRRQLTSRESWCFFPVLLLFYVSEYYFIHNTQPDLAPKIAIGFATILLGFYWIAKNWFPKESLHSQSMILAFATLSYFHAIYLELLPDDARPWLFVIILLGFALIPKKAFTKMSHNEFFVPLAAIGVIAVVEYLEIMWQLLNTTDKLVACVALGSCWVAFISQRIVFREKETLDYLFLVATHLLAILCFYELTTDYGSFAVSASWLLYAIAVMAFAVLRKDKMIAQSSMLVLAFAAGKALLYDVDSAPVVVRIFCLLITGVVLYGAGFFLRKIADWK